MHAELVRVKAQRGFNGVGIERNPVIVALNRGAQIAGCMHNTGEGGISPHHQQGADLLFQFGTGYFGVRDTNGNFDLPRLVDLAAANPVKAI